ncbi:MAG: M24 family metallopeptidase, partial [Bacteroidaceae bacterium]|nr:M24 family metallopeptidase [Bacteroidaceae bacterium]
IEELKKAGEIGYEMHMTAMRECREGVTETYIAGKVDGVAHSMGAMNSFPTILTMHGEIMHGMPKNVPLQAGRLMLCDAGGETFEHYCSDHTRTTPVSRKFTEQQREIYRIVETAHDWIIEHAKIDVMWKDMQIGACKVITQHLKDMGIMKGNVDDAVFSGAHAAFLPCGIGHHMGLDVHDLEGLGQKYVGFDDEHPQSKQFGMKYLRYGIELRKNFIMTVEPGVYFINHLLDDWRAKGLHKDFINYDACDKYRDFGGIRIENDVLITEKGAEFYCDKIAPYHLKDMEEFLSH